MARRTALRVHQVRPALGRQRGESAGNCRRSPIREECEDSLRRLRTPVIDLYQMHWPPENSGRSLEEAWTAMATLQKEGKVRWIGLSNFDVAEMRRADAIAPVTSLQPPYSLIRPEVETTILPFCQQHGIGAISYSPMASGLLTGAMTRGTGRRPCQPAISAAAVRSFVSRRCRDT